MLLVDRKWQGLEVAEACAQAVQLLGEFLFVEHDDPGSRQGLYLGQQGVQVADAVAELRVVVELPHDDLGGQAFEPVEGLAGGAFH